MLDIGPSNIVEGDQFVVVDRRRSFRGVSRHDATAVARARAHGTSAGICIAADVAAEHGERELDEERIASSVARLSGKKKVKREGRAMG